MDLKRWLLAVLLVLGLSFPIGAAPANAALPPGNAVKDPTAILRNALPIDQPDLQELQHRLESTSDDLRAKRWSALTTTARRSQTLLVKASFDNPDGALRDQQRVQALLRFGSGEQLAIPQAAVLLQAGQTFVFRGVSPQEAQRLIGAPITPTPAAGVLVAVQTPVTLGSLQNSRFAVLKGLSANDAVVMGNLAQLRSGMVIPRK